MELNKTKQCEVKGCSRKRHGKKDYCKAHEGRQLQYGDVFADVPLKNGNSVPLAIQRKALQAEPGERYCEHCKRYKKIKEFGKCEAHTCTLCRRNRWLKKYGISNEDYNKLLKKQKGRCALCGTKNSGKNSFFDVDHDHQTGTVRGLLCSRCNLGLGNLEFNNVSINQLTKYLKRKRHNGT